MRKTLLQVLCAAFAVLVVMAGKPAMAGPTIPDVQVSQTEADVSSIKKVVGIVTTPIGRIHITTGLTRSIGRTPTTTAIPITIVAL